MLSIPPATATSIEPASKASCACIAAFIPEPHTLLIVVQTVDKAKSAAIAACRAGACFKPAGNTQPIITSST